MFSMHVACDMHTTLYSQYCDMHVSLNMYGSCMQHAHYMQEISTRGQPVIEPHSNPGLYISKPDSNLLHQLATQLLTLLLATDVGDCCLFQGIF